MFVKNKIKKVDLGEVSRTLLRRNYAVEEISDKNLVIIKNCKFYNFGKEFKELYLYFVGEEVSFKDIRGRLITRIPERVSVKDMYPHLLNILGIPSR